MPNIEAETLRAEIEAGIDALERGEFTEVEGAELDAYLELLTAGVPSHGRLPLDGSPSGGDIQRHAEVPIPMSVSIGVDERTAKLLEARAADLGVTVSELIAELARLEGGSVASDTETIAELDRRWQRVAHSERLLTHPQVVRWLRTWGTPRFRPWASR